MKKFFVIFCARSTYGQNKPPPLIYGHLCADKNTPYTIGAGGDTWVAPQRERVIPTPQIGVWG